MDESLLEFNPIGNLQMNQKPNLLSRRRLRLLVAAVLSPGLLLLCAALWVAYSEVKAARQYRSILNSLKLAGMPFDRASLEQTYFNRTHPEGVSEWLQLIEECQRMAKLGTETNIPFRPKSDLKPSPSELALTGDYLQHCRPLFDQFAKLSRYPTPVRFPMEVNQLGEARIPSLIDIHGCFPILVLELDYAVYKADWDRALKAIDAMMVTIRAIDSRMGVMSNHFSTLLTLSTLEGISRSLSHEGWNAEQLNQLRARVAELYVGPETWRDTYVCERTGLIESIKKRDSLAAMSWRRANPLEHTFYGSLPLFYAGQVRLLELATERIHLADSGLEQLSRSSARFNFALHSRQQVLAYEGAAYWGPTLVWEAIADSYRRLEQYRRLTDVALGLRMFKQREGRWPAALQELSVVGTDPKSLNTLDRIPFPYRPENHGVLVWGFGFRQAIDMEGPNREPSSGEPWLYLE